jgi:cytochrome c-type biogenesis protein CcmH/NrfG
MLETTDLSPATLSRPYADRIRVAGFVLALAMCLGPILRVALYTSFHDGDVFQTAYEIYTGERYRLN